MSADMLCADTLLHIRAAETALAPTAGAVSAFFVLAFTLAVLLRVLCVTKKLLLLCTYAFAQSPGPGFNRPCWLSASVAIPLALSPVEHAIRAG